MNPPNATTQLDAESLREAFFKWADVAISQSNDLWTLCLPFFGICILIIMHLHSKGRAPWKLMLLLYASMFSSGVSFFAGYKLKGSVVTALESTVTNESIKMTDTVAQDGLVQFAALLLALALFLASLGFYSNVVGKALIDTIKGK
ncbi:hypothetical protein RWE87_13195 [Sinorhizobium meliloti]|uniref:hypothetical protein n=1 Tax=Rhizobium meliloti TaxID=382 RepID=UPI00299D1F6E|nr:hypothetical protein [Sinorhizobium meliloti]